MVKFFFDEFSFVYTTFILLRFPYGYFVCLMRVHIKKLKHISNVIKAVHEADANG